MQLIARFSVCLKDIYWAEVRLSDLNKQERRKKIASLLHEVLRLLGENPEREDLKRTPGRWADALFAYMEGIEVDPESHLKVVFQIDQDECAPTSEDMIVVDNIQFTSTCEHHVAPFRGVAHIAYIPNLKTRRVAGLSKLSRLIRVYARRLQLQERMTQQIATAIDKHLDPQGVIVVIQAVHFCTLQRGVEQNSSSMLTTARRGLFSEKPELENKFQQYLSMRLDMSGVSSSVAT